MAWMESQPTHRFIDGEKEKTCEKLKKFQILNAPGWKFTSQHNKIDCKSESAQFWVIIFFVGLKFSNLMTHFPVVFLPLSLTLFFFAFFFGGTTKSVFRVQWRRIKFLSLLSKSHESELFTDNISRIIPDPRVLLIFPEKKKNARGKKDFCDLRVNWEKTSKMGNVFANLFKGLFGKKEMRILVSWHNCVKSLSINGFFPPQDGRTRRSW